MIGIFYLVSALLTMLPAQDHLRHIVMHMNGTSVVGLVDSMNTDSIYIRPKDSSTQLQLNLKNVYYVYNSFGKLYFVSPSYEDRLYLIEERGGFLVTTRGDTLDYTQIEIDRRMDKPFAYLKTVNNEITHKISLFDIHMIRIDASYMENSVRRGCITATCLIVTGLGLQTLSYYSDRRDTQPTDVSIIQKSLTMGGALGTSITNFIPGFSSAGKQYQSLTVFYPVSTLGWMMYDYYFDRRTHYLRPLIREDKFPHSMVWFNPIRTIKKKINEKIEPIRNLLPF